MWRLIAPGLVVIGLLASGPAESQSLRCGGQLVKTGDNTVEVARACGAPDFEDRWEGQSVLSIGPPMMQWTYNDGPGQLLQQILFRGGRVVQIDSAGYGFVDRGVPASGSCDPTGIQPGLSKYRLLHACGPPLTQSGWFVFDQRFDEPGYRYNAPRNRGALVYRERWIYNFGPNRLIREVMLDNARVTEIRLGERGFRP